MRSLSKAGLLVGTTAALLLAGAGAASADSTAIGAAYGSPGVLSGNVVQIPVDVPVNVCGNSVNVIGLLNPAFGNTCVNGGGEQHPAAFHGTHAFHGLHAADWKHVWVEHNMHHGDDCD